MNNIDITGGGLNCGIQENETKLSNLHLHSSSVLDSQEKSLKLGSRVPSEGVTQKGGFLGENNLIGLSQHPVSGGLSLKSLASSHLNDLTQQKTTLGLGLSLGSLSSHQLTADHAPLILTGSQSATSGLSLSSLASNHLCTATSKMGLGSSSGLSLSSLASNHLGGNSVSSMSSSPSTSNTTQFTIPAIFGSKSTPYNQKERSVSPEVEIDLMSALKHSSASQEKVFNSEDEVKEQVVKVELTVPDLSRIKSELRKRKRSEFSKVITRKWTRLDSPSPVVISLPSNRLNVFQFTEPSPDDIVLKAQSQSKAFNRPSPVRQPVLT